jgi:hypothetical protein
VVKTLYRSGEFGTLARVRAGSHPLPLQERVGDRGEHDVMLPPWIRATFEVVEAEFGLQFLILRLDRPALMCVSDQLFHRRGSGQVDEKVLGARCGAEILFAQEPHLGGEPSIAPVVGGCDADGREAGRPRAIRAVAPRHASPRARRQCQRQGAHSDGSSVVDEAPMCQITSVTSNEGSERPGENEWVVTGPLSIKLLAQR